MSSRNNNISDELNDYILANSLRDRPELKALRDVTADMPNAGMQISPDQGQLMALLVKATGARKAIEVGTFTGYSALVVASALPEDGTLVACDVSEEFTSVGRSHWERAGVASKIDLRLGPAVKTLDAMIAAGEAGAVRHGFHRCRQGELPQLLRTLPDPAATGWVDPFRQHAVGRQSGQSEGERRYDKGYPRVDEDIAR